jgi:membrane protein implicated in regulation of membrane protease activity
MPLQARLAAGWLAMVLAGPAAAQNPYSYVKFSLGVPWTLYFVFLALISIPFAVMILLAWRRGRSEEEPQEPRHQESAGAAERPAGK